ncbi:MAG: hypothetical protein HY690_14540 [Chloroflexi bacterium]|nr:hypothetical protein [Chloroflexota bacterium]
MSLSEVPTPSPRGILSPSAALKGGPHASRPALQGGGPQQPLPPRGLPPGAFDLYCTTGPCILPRAGDGFEVAQRAAAAGMGGLVFHNHHEGTVGRAALAAHAAPGLRCYGGVVLNEYAGGLSRKTVYVAMLGGAKCIWMPTTDAHFHAQRLGGTGRSVAKVFDPLDTSPGLSLLEDGRLRRELGEIARVVADFDGLLCTGHASPDEIRALIELAQPLGVPVVVNHPYFLLDEPVDFFRSLVAEGVYFELPSTTRAGSPPIPPARRYVELVQALGSDCCTVGSECMAPHHPVDRLAEFADALRVEGLAEADVEAIFVQTPRRLLGLDQGSEGRRQ